MKHFILVTLWLLTGWSVSAQTLPLDGAWKFERDRQDVGTKEGWFRRELTGKIQWPGTISTNQSGDPITTIRQQMWGGKFTDLPVWHPMLKTDYRGWRGIREPSQYRSVAGEICAVVLGTGLLAVGGLVGTNPSGPGFPQCPARVCSRRLAPGPHRLTLRIDNRPLCDLGCNTHAYHEQSCTIYNGVIGRIELQAHPPLSVRAAQVFADPASGICQLHLRLANTGPAEGCPMTARVSADGQTDLHAARNPQWRVPPGGTN